MRVANPVGVVAQCLLGHNFDLRYPEAFEVGQPVRSKNDHEAGRVRRVVGELVTVRWKDGMIETVHQSTIKHAPGFKPKRRPR